MASSKRLRLKITPRRGDSKIVELPDGPAVVGRQSDCAIHVTDSHFSRRHFVLEPRADGMCLVRALSGKNSLLLNGQVIDVGVLRVGDLLESAETQFELVRAGSCDSSAEPTASTTRRLTVDAGAAATDFGIHSLDARSQRRLELLHRLVECVAVADDQERFLEIVLDTLFAALPCRRGFIASVDSDGELELLKVRETGVTSPEILDMSETVLAEMRKDRSAVLVCHTSDQPPAESAARIGIGAFMSAPLFLAGDLYGFIYIDQPASATRFDDEDLRLLVSISRLTAMGLDAQEHRAALARENLRLREILRRKSSVVARSKVMVELLHKVERVAKRDVPVLLAGETGTGKELLARVLHDRSPRSSGPFIAFNCALTNSALIESELFGHVKGAFTGATRDHKGRFQLAAGGTLFLDEIGDMPVETQAKLLRVLQEWQVWPIGAERGVDIDVRLICATHQDLVQLRGDGRFRDDLYFRIAVLKLEVPPLRERGDDVLAIAHTLLPGGVEIEAAARRALLAYHWPGNVRELQNVLEQASFNAAGRRLRLRDFPAEIAREGRRARLSVPLRSLSELEARHIRAVLGELKGNKKRTAEVLGISRETLYQKLKLYQIDSP